MKKIITLTIAAILLIGMLTFSVSAQEDVSVYIDEEKIEFDVPAQIMDGRTMVPLRRICEALGMYVDFNAETKQITITDDINASNSKFTMVNILGNKTFGILENTAFRSVESDVPTMAINGRTLVPVRVISESLGCDVDWEPTSRSVLISSFRKYPQGQYKIDGDMSAGEYILVSDSSNGSFSITSDDKSSNILKTEQFGRVTYINVLDGTRLELNDCYAIPYTDKITFDVVDNGYVNGVYKCGKDLPAGTYTLSALDSNGQYTIYNAPYDKALSKGTIKEEKNITITEGQYVKLKDIKVTLYKNGSSSVNVNIYEKYENGAPTYTAVTSVELKEKLVLANVPTYRYQYTSYNYVKLYMRALQNAGWILNNTDKTADQEDMEIIYRKSGEYIKIKVDASNGNLWISHYN